MKNMLNLNKKNLQIVDLQPQKISSMKLAIVGATGLVGSELIKIIQERDFKFSEILLVFK